MTGDLQKAEDLVQSAFLRAMLNEELIVSLNEKQARAWLYRTIRNLYIDQVRHSSRETIVEELPMLQKQPEEMTMAEWKNMLDSLPHMEGLLFSMCYLEGYNSRQIGEILSIPPGTVRSKLSSARKHLKHMMGGKQDE